MPTCHPKRVCRNFHQWHNHDVRLFDDRLAARVNNRQTAPLNRTGRFARLAAMPPCTGAKRHTSVDATQRVTRARAVNLMVLRWRSDLAGAR